MSTTVHYDRLNISELRIGDVVRLLPDSFEYGNFLEMLVADIYKTTYPTIDPIMWVKFIRPYAHFSYPSGELIMKQEIIDAPMNHRGLFYSVTRSVDLFENMIIRLMPENQPKVTVPDDYRVIRVLQNGTVVLQFVVDGMRPDSYENFRRISEKDIDWKMCKDQSYFENPELKFFDPKDNHIKQYYDYQPRH